MGYSLRTDRYRLTVWKNRKQASVEAIELYDHQQDPAENVNVAELPENEGLVRQLQEQLTAQFELSTSRNSSGNRLPHLSPLTLPSPRLFPLRGAVEREREPVTYFRTSPKCASEHDRLRRVCRHVVVNAASRWENWIRRRLLGGRPCGQDLLLDRIGQVADVFDFDRHRVAGLKETGGLRAKPTPCGVPVRMTVPGRSVVLPLRNSISAGTSKIMSLVFQSCMVSPLRIVLMPSCVGVGDLVARDEAGAERAEGVERLAATPLAAAPFDLPIAGADIIGTGIAEHVVQGFVARHVLARFADHDGQFAFVVHLRAGQMSSAARSGRPGVVRRTAFS